MKAPTLAAFSLPKAITPRPRATAPGRGTFLTFERLVPLVLLGGIVAAALFFRLFGMDSVITYYPDTYGQLRAIDNLLSGLFPISYQYPPGIALYLSPFFVLLPHTPATMQAAIVASGTLLVVVGYLACLKSTGDRRAALFFAAALALGSIFVFYSRVALFDVISTLLIALSLFLAPSAARRGPLALSLYGLLVFTTITARYLNAIILPALILASIDTTREPLSPRRLVIHLRSRAVVTVGLIVSALVVLYLATSYENFTRLISPGHGSIVSLTGYLPRLGQHVYASLIGLGIAWRWQETLIAACVLIFAGVGARRLWHMNRSLMLAIGWLIIVWSPVHALYVFFWARYDMPAFFFVLLLAALGLSTTLSWLGNLRLPLQRIAAGSLVIMAVSLFAVRQVALDIFYTQHAPSVVNRYREQDYDVIRAALRDLDGPSSVLLSSQALGIDRANPAMTSYDLIRHSASYGINDDSVARLLSYVQAQQERGKTVYYHYTAFEDLGWSYHTYEQDLDTYFIALQQSFALREIAGVDERPQRLYVLDSPSATR